jgi:hypothetical protein
MRFSLSVVLFGVAMLLPLIPMVDLRNQAFWPGLILILVTIISFKINRQLYNYVFYFVNLLMLIVSTIVFSWIVFEISSKWFNVKGEDAYGFIFGAILIYVPLLIIVTRMYYVNRVYSLEFYYLIFVFLFIVTCKVLQNTGVGMKSPFT